MLTRLLQLKNPRVSYNVCPIIDNDEIDSLSLRAQYLTYTIENILQSTFYPSSSSNYFWPTDISNFIISYIQDLNEGYLQMKCNLINIALTKYFTEEDCISDSLRIVSKNDTFIDWINYNPKLFIEYISFLIGRYAGGYGWDIDNHPRMHNFSHTSRIVYHTPRSYDVVCAIADEEIYSNCTDENPLWFAEVFVQKKFDEMWIGVAWNEKITSQYGWGIRHYKPMVCYYGGRESFINSQKRQWMSNAFDVKMTAFEKKQKLLQKQNKDDEPLLDIENYDQNISNNNNNSTNSKPSGRRRSISEVGRNIFGDSSDDDDDGHFNFKVKYDVQWKEFKFNIVDYTKEYSGSLVDCAPGAIQGYGQSPYQYKKAMEFYTNGDFVGVLVHGKERWVRFYCNGRFQGEKIQLPGEDDCLGKRLWLYATTDSGTDTLVLCRKVWDKGTNYE